MAKNWITVTVENALARTDGRNTGVNIEKLVSFGEDDQNGKALQAASVPALKEDEVGDYQINITEALETRLIAVAKKFNYRPEDYLYIAAKMHPDFNL